MNFVASLVLPLQGFWNGLIYFITSLPATRKLWRSWTGCGARGSSARNSTEILTPGVFAGGKRNGSVSQISTSNRSDY